MTASVPAARARASQRVLYMRDTQPPVIDACARNVDHDRVNNRVTILREHQCERTALPPG